ncbi:hypothetical protein BgiBS90_022805, partial [Biomphalaria glabrata]
EGSITYADTEWDIRPVTEGAGGAEDKTHKVFKQVAKENLFFDGDVVISSQASTSKSYPTTGHESTARDGAHPRGRRALVHHVVELSFVVDFAEYN